MNFNKHSNLQGSHAFLSASTYSWVNYNDEKLSQFFMSRLAAQRGTELHELASMLIKQGVRLPKSNKSLNNYVNDCIGFRMKVEQILYYSPNIFGTADAIGMSKNRETNRFRLRIADLKTGLIEASFTQLEIYAALFCLEYNFRPFEIEIELRIYQNNVLEIVEPDPDVIFHIMDKIISFDKQITNLRIETEH